VDEILHLERIALILEGIAETSIQLQQDIVGAETMSLARNEGDGVLACTREIENRKPRALFKEGAKLIQAVAVASVQLGFNACCRRLPRSWRGREWERWETLRAAWPLAPRRLGGSVQAGLYRYCL